MGGGREAMTPKPGKNAVKGKRQSKTLVKRGEDEAEAEAEADAEGVGSVEGY